MPKYKTKVDRWLSHECRTVKAGEEFTTEFPSGPDGKPMKLGDNLELVEDETPAKGAKSSKGKGSDDLT